jgi:hypothetical protein
MAITVIDYLVLKKLRESGLMPSDPSVLELGEANWYGDIPAATLSEAIEDLVENKASREELHQRMVDITCGNSPYKNWDLAKVFYKVFLNYSRIQAIDFHGTPDAAKLDLNHPIALGAQFDVLINGGTAEHVFNVFQFFKTAHDVTRPGGLMLHSMPFCGWVEHGFYNFNPTFYWDLALANQYTILVLAYAEVTPPRLMFLKDREQIIEMSRSGDFGRNAVLYAVFRKAATESEFRIPIQGIYGGVLSEDMTTAWRDVR